MVLDVMFLWIIVAFALFIMVVSILACLCGCCTKAPRDELMGLSGMVKITNPDVLQNNTPLALSITRTPSDDNVPNISVPSSNTSVKRNNNVGNNIGICGGATRSLPEIPVDAVPSTVPNGSVVTSNNFIVYNTSDTNSDLYATLEEHKITTSIPPKPKFGSSSQSNGTVTYEQINENVPYSKLKEHPYAQVDEVDGAVGTSSRHDQDLVDGIHISSEENTIDIPAASAITGNIAASNELPYMTPPLHNNHFSGDSQDSSKGYTSITVREPIACIRPQTKLANQDTTDSHYTVLSDDSDEMYAAIQEAYTSGSETYAQIQPVASTSTHAHVHQSNQNSNKTNLSTAPSCNDHSVHSRQASSSSVSSSATNRNSPKEKRQANSPLPKPPDLTPDDMYAKVLKKKKYENEWYSSKDSVFSVEQESSSNVAGFYTGVPNLEAHSNENNDTQKDKNDEHDVDDADNNSQSSRCYETLPERNYEILPEINQSLGYETVKERYQNPGYESLPEPDSLTPGYERIREPSLGYEKIRYEATEEDDPSEPNYEELRPKKDSESSFHCYATIEKKKPTGSANAPEPDYASLTRHREAQYDSWNNNDPFYERIQKQSDDEGDDEDSNYDKIGAKPKDKCNDTNDRAGSNTVGKSEELPVNHSISETDLSELYSKVNKTKR